MKHEIQIVHLDPGDWQKYKDLRLRALKHAPQAFGASYDDTIIRPDEYWRNRLEQHGKGQSWSLFAQMNTDLVGMLEAAIHSTDPDRVWLHAMYVDEAYRGLGIAGKLMEAILQELSLSQAPRIVKLGVNQQQLPAVNLYKRFGFEIIGEMDYTMGSGETVREFIMQKALQNITPSRN